MSEPIQTGAAGDAEAILRCEPPACPRCAALESEVARLREALDTANETTRTLAFECDDRQQERDALRARLESAEAVRVAAKAVLSELRRVVRWESEATEQLRAALGAAGEEQEPAGG